MGHAAVSLSDLTYHHLLNMGLSHGDVEHLMAQVARQTGRALDGTRCRAGLARAAQGGDAVAVKLAALAGRDPHVDRVALAYGALHAGA